MKKIVSVFIIVAMLLGSINGFAQTNKQQDVLSLLSELNIMKGDPDGNLRTGDAVSRAEFAKIAIAMSAYRNSVATNLSISPFKDVLYSHWAAPYIKLAVQNRICKGYPDGAFLPDSQVLYEEAVTMLLKVLGYTDEDFGISWPYGQVGLAQNLEINKNISKKVGDVLTRGDVAVLVYNALNTKIKNSNKKQITVFDSEIIEDAVIIATTKEDPSVNTDKVLTSNGAYKIDSDFDYSMVGKKGDLVIKNGTDFVSFAPYDQTTNRYVVTSVIGSDLVLERKVLKIDENLITYYKSQKLTYKTAVGLAEEGDTFVTYENSAGVIEYAVLLVTHSSGIDIATNLLDKYVIYSKLDDKLVAYKDGAFIELDIADSTVAYKDKLRTVFQALKPELEMGDILYVKMGTGNDIDYVSYEKGKVEGPVTVKSSDWINQFNIGTNYVAIMRDGKKVTAFDMAINDIVYYSKDLNMILGYANKVDGVYEKALPNKDMPSSVVISGITYPIEGVAAFNALSSNGRFDFGDTVTLLLGKTNGVADVVSPSDANASVYGYLFDTGKKEYIRNDNTKYSAAFIKIALPNGKVFEYAADKDYEDYKNSIVRVRLKDGIATADVVSTQGKVEGKFNWSAKKLGDSPLAYDVKILDVTTLYNRDVGNYVAVFPQRMDGLDLGSNSVLFTQTNDKNEITAIILNNVTGDAYKYGMVIEAKNKTGMILTGTYKYDIDGKTSSFTTQSVIYGVNSGEPTQFVLNANGQIAGMQPITRLDGTVLHATAAYVETSEGKFLLSDKAVVYKKTFDFDYMMIPLKDIIGNSSYKLSAYYDKPIASGGRVRVIIAMDK